MRKSRCWFIRCKRSGAYAAFLHALLIAAVALCASADSYGMQKIFTLNNESSSAGAVFPLADGDGYMVLSDHGTKQNLTKFNQYGQSVLSRDFLDVSTIVPGATNGYPHGAVRTSDGGYLISGLINPRPQKGFLIKLDSNLKFVWGKIMTHNDPTKDMWMGGVKETSDGHFIVQVKGQYPWPFVGIVKLNKNGSLDWQKRLDTNFAQNEIFDIIETASAYVIYNAIEVGRGTNDWDLALFAINKDGTGTGPNKDAPQWGFALGGDLFDGAYTVDPEIFPHASGIVQIDSTHLAVAAYTKSFGVNPASLPGDTNGKSVLLVSFLADGTAFTGLSFLDGPGDDLIAGPYGATNFIKLSDGNLLLGGMTESTWTGSYPGAFLVKITPDLQNFVWQRVYTPYSISGSSFHANSGALFQAVAESSAGDIVAVGKLAVGTPATYESIFSVIPSTGEGDWSCLYESVSQFTLTPLSGTQINASLLGCDTNLSFCIGDGFVNITSFSTPPSSTPSVNLTCYPQVSVTPSPSESFGLLQVNKSSAHILFTVANSAACPNRLILSQDPFVTGADSSLFHITPVNCDYLSLDPGKSCTINIAFTPASTGSKSAVLRVVSNDPDTPVWDVALTGTGTAIPPAQVLLHINGVPYTSLQAAYGAALNGAIIQLREGNLPGSLNAAPTNKTVTLNGGYNAAYTSDNGITIIQGTITISAGTLLIDKVAVR